MKDTLKFVVNEEGEIIKNNDSKPSEKSDEMKNIKWLSAASTVHIGEETNAGKWVLEFTSEHIDKVWNIIKNAVQERGIWKAQVSTYNAMVASHKLLVYTFNKNDKDEVRGVYKYLQEEGLVEINEDKDPKYRTDDDEKIRNGECDASPYVYKASDILLKDENAKKPNKSGMFGKGREEDPLIRKNDEAEPTPRCCSCNLF